MEHRQTDQALSILTEMEIEKKKPKGQNTHTNKTEQTKPTTHVSPLELSAYWNNVPQEIGLPRSLIGKENSGSLVPVRGELPGRADFPEF